MKKFNLKQAWLNSILHLSSLIYKLKHQVIYAGIFKTILLGALVLLLEVLLSLISLPFYFFVVPDKTSLNFKDGVQAFRLRQRITIGAVVIFLVWQLFNLFLTGTGLFSFSSSSEASNSEWDFENAEEYRFDSPYLAFNGGKAIFDPTAFYFSQLKERQEVLDKEDEEKKKDNKEDEEKNKEEENDFSLKEQEKEQEYEKGDQEENQEQEEQDEKDEASQKEARNSESSEKNKEESKSNSPTPSNSPSGNSSSNSKKNGKLSSVNEFIFASISNEKTERLIVKNEDFENEERSVDLDLTCTAQLESLKPWEASRIKQWNVFDEKADKNEGEIFYQLSLNGGEQWIYFDGEDWKNALEADYSTAEKINKGLSSLPTQDAQVLFRAFFVNDCSEVMTLDEISIRYAHKSSDEIEKESKENKAEKEQEKNDNEVEEDHTKGPNNSDEDYKNSEDQEGQQEEQKDEGEIDADLKYEEESEGGTDADSKDEQEEDGHSLKDDKDHDSEALEDDTNSSERNNSNHEQENLNDEEEKVDINETQEDEDDHQNERNSSEDEGQPELPNESDSPEDDQEKVLNSSEDSSNDENNEESQDTEGELHDEEGEGGGVDEINDSPLEEGEVQDSDGNQEGIESEPGDPNDVQDNPVPRLHSSGHSPESEFQEDGVIELEKVSNAEAGNSSLAQESGTTFRSNLKISFKDIEGHWAKPYIERMQSLCGIEGYPDPINRTERLFRPNQKITRAELLAMILKCSDQQIVEPNQAPFPDVPLKAWHAKFVARGKSLDIVSGYGDGLFRPDGFATRAEALKIILLSKIVKIDIDRNASSETTFNCFDVKASAWYKNYFNFALKRNIISGYSDSQGRPLNQCRPDNQITRAEAAKLIVNLNSIF